MDKNKKRSPKDKTVGAKVSRKIQFESVFLQENINRFSERLFKENAKLFSRYIRNTEIIFTIIPFRENIVRISVYLFIFIFSFFF